MKLPYLLVCVALFAVAGIFAKLHLTRVSLPPEPLLADANQGNDEAHPAATFPAPGAQSPQRASLAALAERNPFSPNGAAGAAGTGTGGDLELVGVLRAGEELHGAILRDRKSGETKFWCVGESLPNGFVLRDVMSDRVVIRRRAEEQVLVMVRQAHVPAEALTTPLTKPARATKPASANGTVKPPPRTRTPRTPRGERSGGLFQKPENATTGTGRMIRSPASESTSSTETGAEEEP